MSVTCSIRTEVKCLVGGINGAERLNDLFGCTWEVCVRVQSRVGFGFCICFRLQMILLSTSQYEILDRTP